MIGEAEKQAVQGWHELLIAHLGQAGATLVWTLISVAGAVLTLMSARYTLVLGYRGLPNGSPERQVYDSLISSLRQGGIPARLYSLLLTRFLGTMEVVLGDAGTAQFAFGMEKGAPLWTAAAFNRCLLFTAPYMMATILVIWAVSGHVGPAEAVLGLKSDSSSLQRALVAIAGVPIVTASFGRLRIHQLAFRLMQYDDETAERLVRKMRFWRVMSLICLAAMLSAFYAASSGTYVAVFIIATSQLTSTAAIRCSGVYRDSQWAWTGNFGLVSVAAAVSTAIWLSAMHVGGSVFLLAFLLLGLLGSVLWILLSVITESLGKALSLAVSTPAGIFVFIAAANVLSPLSMWHQFGPILLFIGVFSLTNLLLIGRLLVLLGHYSQEASNFKDGGHIYLDSLISSWRSVFSCCSRA
jgi:hypothetical protein